MGHLFFIGLFAVLSIVSLVRPWVGVVASYFVAILTPQAVWYWDFEDLRPAFWILAPTCIGATIGLLRGSYDLGRLWTARVLFIVILWLCILASYLWGPYTDVEGPFRFADPDWALSVLNKIFLVCLLACLVIDDARKVWVLSWVMTLSGAYLVYWANGEYLAGHFSGRLAGPVNIYTGASSYADENAFATVFVVAQPFIWYTGHAMKHAWLRWGLWLIIPFTWHAVFLTGSRGGLVGLAATLLIMAFRSKRRALGVLLLPAFIVVYQWQAGAVMKERAGTIQGYESETSAETRIEAWHAAAGMIAAHPLGGVGLASFGVAFPHYSDKKPRQAHNTFMQIAAESGIPAGLMYLLLAVGSVIALWRNGDRLKARRADAAEHRLYLMNEAALSGMFGFVVCAVFLSLQMSEILFYLCALAHAILLISRQPGAPITRTILTPHAGA